MQRQIDTDIPMPERAKYGSWRDEAMRMEVGHSILVPTLKESCCLGNAIARLGYVWRTKKSNKGFRVWKGEKK